MKREYVIEIITRYVNKGVAETIVERLEEEGLLNLHYGDSDVSTIVEAFKEAFGTTRASKYDRFSATRLARKHGAQSVVQIIKILAAKSDDKYAPTVRDVSQLEQKWVSVVKFLRGQAETYQEVDL